MRKTLLASLILTLAWVGLPGDAEAATSLSIRGADPATKTVTISYQDGKVGDWYHIYSNDKVLFNTLNASDVQQGSKTIDVSALGDMRNGDEIRAELRSQAFPQYLHDRFIVGGQLPGPELMTLNTRSNLVANGQSQSLSMQITGPYSPEAADTIRVTPYNSSGNLEGSVQYFALPAQVLAASDTVFNLPLSPAPNTARYDIEVLRANTQVLAKAQYHFSSSPSPEPGETSSLVLQYPATAKAGEQVSGKVFMTDANGNQIDITGLAAFGFEGPMDQSSLGHGSFRVAADAQPGQQIVVKASLGDHQGQVLIQVEGAAQAPTPSGADVVMTINSRTFVVNGLPQETEVAPFIQENRTFVPVRALAESFGATVEFNPSTYQITIRQGDRTILMTANSRYYTVNGVGKTMDVAPYISYSGRTIVPVRFAAEALGYEIDLTYMPDGGVKDILFSNPA